MGLILFFFVLVGFMYLEEFHFRSYNLIGWRFVFNYPNRGSMGLGQTCYRMGF